MIIIISFELWLYLVVPPVQLPSFDLAGFSLSTVILKNEHHRIHGECGGNLPVCYILHFLWRQVETLGSKL